MYLISDQASSVLSSINILCSDEFVEFGERPSHSPGEMEMGMVIAWADVATSMDQMSVGSNDTVASFLTEILSGGDLGHKFFTSQPLQSSSLVIVVS